MENTKKVKGHSNAKMGHELWEYPGMVKNQVNKSGTVTLIN
jgi:hypothetical protein